MDASAAQGLLQYGAIGIMLLLSIGALMWVFKRMDTRLEETQKAADTDRKEYSKSLQSIAEKSVAAHENSINAHKENSQVMGRLCDKIDGIQCRNPFPPERR